VFMSESCTVVIGAPELLDGLRQNTVGVGEVLSFSDTEPLKALEAITTRRPAVIAFERLFAATSRGAALINRIKADPTLSGAEIRVVAHDGSYSRVSPRRTPLAPIAVGATPERASATAGRPAVSAPAAQNLDFRGTRRAQRFRMADGTDVQVEGTGARVVDLSTIGAQIVSPVPLKPQQRLRMVLADELGIVRFAGSVAWVSFEIPKGVSRYRAGIEFSDVDATAVDAFRQRHQS